MDHTQTQPQTHAHTFFCSLAVNLHWAAGHREAKNKQTLLSVSLSFLLLYIVLTRPLINKGLPKAEVADKDLQTENWAKLVKSDGEKQKGN